MKWYIKLNCPWTQLIHMPINTKTLIRALGLVITMLVSLSACAGNDIPYGEYRIEWDELDPRLHGQAVLFNEPMIYAVFSPEDQKNGWVKEIIQIGRYLQDARSDRVIIHKPAESIIDGMLFRIKGSFWHRKDWLNRGFGSDTHYLLMEDENGVESITSFYTLSISSNRKDLAGLRDEGRFKE